MKHEYKTGWIGVDFDGTLAEYHGWKGALTFGKPIPSMVERVKQWVSDGEAVKIMTARSAPQKDIPIGFSFEQVREAVSDWCLEHIGTRLEVVHSKDYAMTELWDDRAVQVEMNTGKPLVADLRARLKSAEDERDRLEKQEHNGMDCTLDQMLSKEQQAEWGFDKQEHGRNIQLMFCRALDAINQLEDEAKATLEKFGGAK